VRRPRNGPGQRANRPARQVARLPEVPAAEQHRVHEQREQLPEAHPLAPPVGERGRLVVRRQRAGRHPAEQRQHREVDLAVPAVRRGVDEPRPPGAVGEHVAGPQVAVQPGRGLGRRRDRHRRHLPLQPHPAGQRQQPVLAVVLVPVVALRRLQLAAPDEERASPRQRAEPRCARAVQRGQHPAQLLLARGVERPGVDPLEHQRARPLLQHPRHPGAAVGKPAQPGRLERGRVPFDEGRAQRAVTSSSSRSHASSTRSSTVSKPSPSP
jgi:hypothetical protein